MSFDHQRSENGQREKASSLSLMLTLVRIVEIAASNLGERFVLQYLQFFIVADIKTLPCH